MLPADPAQPRQLSDRDPILLWRHTPSGRKEGLALSPQSCEKPACTCREVSLEVLAVDDDLIGIDASDREILTISAPNSARQPHCVLRVLVDIDSGDVKLDNAGPPVHQDAAALAWLRTELASGPLLDRLRRRFRLDKHLAVEPPAPRAFAWSRWKPGDKVSWDEVFPEALPLPPVVVAGHAFRVQEWYCANPQCGCHDVELFVLASRPDGKEQLLGRLKIDFRARELLELKGPEEQVEVVLTEVWATLKARHDVTALFGRRHSAVQAAASVGVRQSQRRPVVSQPKRLEPARNSPCPCGSGLKYKRCCLGKHDPRDVAEPPGSREASSGSAWCG